MGKWGRREVPATVIDRHRPTHLYPRCVNSIAVRCALARPPFFLPLPPPLPPPPLLLLLGTASSSASYRLMPDSCAPLGCVPSSGVRAAYGVCRLWPWRSSRR